MSTTDDDRSRWTTLYSLSEDEKKSLHTVLRVLYGSKKFNTSTSSGALFLKSAVDDLNGSNVWTYLKGFRAHQEFGGQFTFEEIIDAAKSEVESSRPTNAPSEQEMLEAYTYLQSYRTSTSGGLPTAPPRIVASNPSIRFRGSLKAVVLGVLAASAAALAPRANAEAP